MNILLSSAGRRNYLVDYFRRTLDGNGLVFTTDANSYAPAMAEADRAFVVPRVNEDGYFDHLLEICQKHNVRMLLSLNDLELPGLALWKEQFAEAGIQVVISSPEVIRVCGDKIATARFLDDNNLSVPATYENLEEVYRLLDEGRLNFPLIVKARWGSGSIGLGLVGDRKELDITYAHVQMQVRKSFLSQLQDNAEESCVVVQPCIPGTEFHLDVVNDLQGQHQATLAKKKLAMRAGETDKATTVEHDNLTLLGARLGQALKHIGNLDCDVISGPEGDFIIDLNPRFGGGYPFSHMAGANVPAALIAWANGQEPVPEWLCVRPGVTSAKCDRLVSVEERAKKMSSQKGCLMS